MDGRYNDIQLYVDYMAGMNIDKLEAIEILQNYFVDPVNTPAELSATFIQDNMGEIITAIKTSPKFISEKREYVIKTFEQFSDDNTQAQLEALKHLKDIEAFVNVVAKAYKMPRTKRTTNYSNVPNRTFEVVEFGDGWYVYANEIPYVKDLENDKTTTQETSFINDDLKVSLVVTSNYHANFWETSPETNENPAENDGSVDFEIQQLMYYKNDGNDEYFIELTAEVSSVLEEIINKIEDK